MTNAQINLCSHLKNGGIDGSIKEVIPQGGGQNTLFHYLGKSYCPISVGSSTTSLERVLPVIIFYSFIHQVFNNFFFNPVHHRGTT